MFKTSPIDSKIDAAITTLLAEMEKIEDKSTDAYAKLVDQMSKLYKLREETSVSKDTWATIAANIAGILLILNFERAGVIATKSLGLVRKLF